MKKLILYDHIGNKLLEQDVFVEGQDFHWQSYKPMAFWLGEICLVDRELELKPLTVMEEIEVIDTFSKAAKEEKVEPTEVHNQDTRDSRASEAVEHEGVERLLEKPAGGELTKRGRRARKRKAA